MSAADGEAGWKALPVAAVGALYVNGIQRFVRENLVMFFGAGTGFAALDSLGWREFALFVALALSIGLLIAVIYRRRFRYRVDGEAVRVRQGLFEQKELKVRFERVQNIGFSQPIYLRPFGLTRVQLETPGAAQTEVRLPGIHTAEAEAIRDWISGRAGAVPFTDGRVGEVAGEIASADDADASVSPMFEAGPGDLFRFGLTSNQVWILAALFGAPVMNWVERQTSDVLEQAGASGMLEAGAFAHAPFMLALLAGGFIVALAMVLMTLSGVVAVIRYHGFRLGIEGDRIKGRFGLLDAREKTLRREKMHSLELAQSAVGRVLGQWHAVGRQTGAGQAGEQVNQDRRLLVPGIDCERLDHVASGLLGMDWRMPAWSAIEARFRTMLWTRISVVLIVWAVLSWLLLPGRPVWPACAILGFNVLVLLLVHLHWKRWSYALRGSRLSVRSGLVGQKIVEFELSRCQQVAVLTSPYQRRHGLATLKLRLPHGEQAIPYLPGDVAAGLANRLLFEAERAHSHAL